MRRYPSFVVAVTVALLAFGAAARAAVIDFEDAPLGSYRSYTLHGVRFSTVFCYDVDANDSLDTEPEGCFQGGVIGGEFNPGTFIAFKDAGFTPGHSYGALTIPTGEGVYPGVLAEFPVPVTTIGVDIGGYAWPDVGGFYILPLDANRMPAGEARRRPPGPGTPAEMLHLEAVLSRPATYALIYARNSVRYPGDSEYTFVGNSAYIDNLTFEALPEPATCLVPGAGLAWMLFGTRRRVRGSRPS